jgi:LysR family tcuABC transcriptional regulator
MELRQIKYLLAAIDHGSIGKAACELGLATSALSQQISRLESELAVRLLNRGTTGVTPTQAGESFCAQMRLAMRHIDAATEAAKGARLSGAVSLGLAPTTSSILALPIIEAMRQRYPGVRLQIVEGMSGHLANMLKSRQIDLAVLFNHEAVGFAGSEAIPMLDERLFLIGPSNDGLPVATEEDKWPTLQISALKGLPLILPSRGHGLRGSLDRAFASQNIQANLTMEIDSLAVIMDAVAKGIGYTIQPGAALNRIIDTQLSVWSIEDANAFRTNILASLPDKELSPAALALRAQLRKTASRLVRDGLWIGATLHEN